MAFLSPAHDLKIVLMQPQIAPNTGNIARLCVASGAELHLVRPLGFVLSDHYLKRSAMDYWERVKLTVHDDADAFFKATDPSKLRLFSSKASHGLWETSFARDEYLVFGSETRGIDPSILAAHSERLVRIPQVPDERCLNLSTAAGIALYEAIRQIGDDQSR
jgi:tRNA (cytidine/uridine-2'-O-)-methyltransferase